MSRFFLTIKASALYSTISPTLEVLVDGFVISSTQILTATGSGYDTLFLTLDFDGTAPGSLSFRFEDSAGEGGRAITLESVELNGQDILGGLADPVLSQYESTSLNTTTYDYLFARTVPDSADLGDPTINGTSGDDTYLAGTGGADVIDGADGHDRIYGVDDGDAITGGNGNDYLFGEDGNDIITGGNGDDTIFGNAGDDLLFGEGDNDTIIGGAGKDVLNGGTGSDALLGGDDDDVIFGEGGVDYILGGDGDDSLFGDDGADLITGGTGNDTIYGGIDGDSISGGTGNDTIYGQDGADDITGNAGADTIRSGDGADRISAGAGDDTAAGGNDDDTIWGDDGADELDGGAGNDALFGGDGSDTLNGGDGNDYLHGHAPDMQSVSDILNNNPGMSFNPETGSFYQYVSSGTTFSGAYSAAQGTTLNGVSGHMVTIGSQTENDYVFSLTGGAETWIGASDSQVDGEWRWLTGDESQTSFWLGDGSGSAQSGLFANWGGADPNGGSGATAAIMNNAGTWYDRADTESHGYVIEWEIGLFSDDDSADILNGDNGDDILYGYGGDDTLTGGGGADILYGGDGDDDLSATGQTTTTAPEFSSGGFSSYAGSQDSTGTVQIIEDGNGFSMTGNAWKKYALNTDITSDTILEFDFKSTVEGEIQAFGFETDDNFGNDSTRFKLWGTQSSGMNYAAPQSTYSYDGSGDWMHYTIDVGTYFTGAFNYLAFVNDHDVSGADGNSWYRNIRLYDVSDADTAGSTLFGGSGDDTLTGSDQDDFLYDSEGTNTLSGGAGNDVLDARFDSSGLSLAEQASQIEADNSGVYYSSSTGNFYQYVNSNVNLATATSNAAAATINGVSGHLVTITSGAENSFVSSLISNDVWIAANDIASEGVWVWDDGPEAGQQFWSGDENGSVVGGMYNNWNGGEPNDWGSGEDGAEMRSNGIWNDISATGNNRYVIEWEGDNLLTPPPTPPVQGDNTLNGGAGNDVIYGDTGNDTINGGSGDDTMDGGSGNDIMNGDAGIDILTGGTGDDTMDGGTENDTISGDEGSDTLYGGAGNDTLHALSAAPADSQADAGQSNALYGEGGNDTLYGSSGTDTLDGGSGDDNLHSASLADVTSADILAAYPSLVYNSTTGSFYQYVSSAETWTNADSAAQSTIVNGVSGHLAVVTSATENSYLDSISGSSTIWLGGSDANSEGVWEWTDGPDAGTFWIGASGGSLQSPYTYENWNGGEPNDYSSGEDYIEMQNGGGWNDNGGPSQSGLTRDYVIEWEASQVLTTGNVSTLAGGDGLDNLYGADGADVFVFDSATAFNDTDVIHDFDDSDADIIDIADVLSGLGVNAGNLGQYVDIDAGSGLRVDTSGSSTFGAATLIATFSGTTSVTDEATMLSNGNLII